MVPRLAGAKRSIHNGRRGPERANCCLQANSIGACYPRPAGVCRPKSFTLVNQWVKRAAATGREFKSPQKALIAAAGPELATVLQTQLFQLPWIAFGQGLPTRIPCV